ncbi:MAG: enoyl-CoA hydratase-related protein [Acidimicrobiia bacterium]
MPLHVDRHDRVALLTLDEPERRNALTPALVSDIVATMDWLDADDTVGAIVVTGASPAFCSGADVSALQAMAKGDEEPADIRDIYAGFLRVLHSPLPTVAAVNGPAVGAGCNLALACDVRVAGESAMFDARFLRIGIHPGGGHTWLLDRAAGPQATAALDLFGERLDGPRAAAVGLAWECVADGQLLERALGLASRAAELPRELAIRTKTTIRHTPWLSDHDAAMRFELEHQVWSLRQGFGAVPSKR